MRSRSLSIIALSLTAALVVTPTIAIGWSNGGFSADPDDPDYGTHDWIADNALGLQTKDVSHFRTTYHDSYLIGTEAPDNSQYIGDFATHHVYYYSDGSLQDDSSAVRSKAMYDLALARLDAGEFRTAAYYMGAMTHYISDIGVFGHTMGAYTDWGSETHHNDYENAFESMLQALHLPSTVSLGYSSAYDATLSLARAITFGDGAIKSNVWMDDHYNWSDSTFVSSAKASLYRAVSAVAAAINHLLTASQPPPPEPPTLPPTAPGPPTGVEAFAEDSYILLVWSPPESNGGSPIIEYRIYRGTSPTDPSILAIVGSSGQSWEDATADKGITYYYWVTARNSAGESTFSGVASSFLEQDDGQSSLLIPIIASGIAAALASGGVVLLRRRSREERK